MNCEIVSWSMTNNALLVELAHGLFGSRITTHQRDIKKSIDLLQQLLHTNNVYHHFNLTIAQSADYDTLIAFSNNTDIYLDIIPTGKQKVVGIMSGNLRQWREAIVDHACTECDDTRALANVLMNKFVVIGLSDLFNDYNRKKQRDKTYALVRR